LIRYASYPENGSAADRALAYELATRLVLAVEAEVGIDAEIERPTMSSESTVAA
jgi:hypothetical protein